MDYRPELGGGGRKTAGWFVIGFGMLLGFGFLLSLLFSLLSRKLGVASGWLCVLLVFGVLIVTAWKGSTPAARLELALDLQPPSHVEILRLRMSDSFNDGSTIVGICAADRSFVESLIKHHAMESKQSAGPLRGYFPGVTFPYDVQAWAGEELTIYHDNEESKLYFHRRLGASVQ